MIEATEVQNEQPTETPEEELTGRPATQLPQPMGFRILCAVPTPKKVYENGILKADATVNIETTSTIVLLVLKLGGTAYKDKERFPEGPWCKEGDFILTRAYSGTRIRIHGQEFRIINDDTVEAVVEDPRGIERV